VQASLTPSTAKVTNKYKCIFRVVNSVVVRQQPLVRA